MNGDTDILADALSLPDPERAAFLTAACLGDAGQRARIEALLRGYAGAQQVLHTPLVTRIAAVPEEKIGDFIGRYKLLQRIGEGGMGVVYLAGQDEPVRRRVALKIIKLGMDTKEVVARFEAERQALALMEHPNIARVFDGGATGTGRPYFVMELVRGVRITEYCDEARLSTRARLDLFIQVCQAIQHAHQKGIIHRDIKPSNILVTVNDGVAVPKVIDFGIAKALPHLRERLTEETIVTQFAALIGTPAYMSPEQAVMTSVDIDTRSDIYSLGVVLYEMLTGRTPFDAKALLASGLDEIRRTIREQEPARPSTRLATLPGEELSTAALRRSSDNAKLMHQLKGDLDWIVMKCLEKDRARRYETASSLVADLNRHLNSEAVVARPPSAAYRLQKMIRRNRLAFAAATVVALSLLAAAGFSTWSFLREREARASETAQRMTAVEAQAKAEAALAREAEQRTRADAGNVAARRNLYAAHLNLAQQAWEQTNLSRLRQLLEETRAYPERGFEWYYWQRQTHLARLTLRGYLSHEANVWAVAFSPDGRRLVTGNGDHNARVWDAVSGQQLFRLENGSQFRSVAYSPNGHWIIAGMNDGTLKRWDAASGHEQLTFNAHRGRAIKSVSFSPDSEQIVTGSEDATARVWTTSGQELLTLTGHRAEVSSVAFAPDGQRIVTGSFDRTAKVWRASTGVEELSLAGHTGAVLTVDFASGGQRVVTGSTDRTARIWDAVRGRELHLLSGHDDAIAAAVFSPDGQRVATGSWDRTIRLWNATSGDELRTFKGHEHRINAVAFSPDGRRIASGNKDQTARIWDAAGDSGPTTLRGHASRISSVALSPDGKRIVTGSRDKTAKVWATEDNRELLTLHGHEAPVSSVDFSPDGRRIFTGSEDQTVRLWDTNDGRELLSLLGHTGPVWCGAFSPDGKRLVTGSADRTTRVWDAISGRELFALHEAVGATLAVAFSPDGQHIATGGSNHSLTLWDAANRRELWKVKGHTASILSVSFSRDGGRIITGSYDGSAKVWDSASGRELLTLKGHTEMITAVVYSPDDRRIITGSGDQTFKVWDATGGQELLSLSDQRGAIGSVALSTNGQLLVTGNHDGTASVWRAAGETQVAAWQEEEREVAQRLAALARERPGLPSFSDAATTAERYLAALEPTTPTEQDLVRMARTEDEGAIKRWLVLAPIPWPTSKGRPAFDSEQIEGESRITPRAGEMTAWENGILTWQELRQDDFVINFITVLGRVTERSVAYAVCYLHSEKVQSGLRLLVGSDARAQVYLNGKRVYENRTNRPFDPDRDTVSDITLNAGRNVVMLKVVIEADARRWRDSIRFTDAQGDPVKGITVTLDPNSSE